MLPLQQISIVWMCSNGDFQFEFWTCFHYNKYQLCECVVMVIFSLSSEHASTTTDIDCVNV